MSVENIRVNELAKELNLTSKEVLDKFAQLSIPVKSHSSTVSADQMRKLKDFINAGSKIEVKKPKAFIVKKAKVVAEPEVEKPEPQKTETKKVETPKDEALSVEVEKVEKPKIEVVKSVPNRLEIVRRAPQKSPEEAKPRFQQDQGRSTAPQRNFENRPQQRPPYQGETGGFRRDRKSVV